MEAFAYFPAIVYRDERPDLVEKALPIAVQYLNDARDPMWGFNQSLHMGGNPDLQEVANYLLLSSVDILRWQGYSVEKYDFYLQGFWAQELNKGAGTNVHVHKNSQICGWFFLETPKNGAYPNYYDTRTNKNMVELDFVQTEEITNATNTISFNNVQSGTVLFSNSWMQHQLIGGVSDQPTRCIHFIVSHKERLCNM